MLMAVLTAIVTSCSTSQKVGGGMLQKRRYTKGFYWNHRGSDASAKQTVVKADVTLEEAEAEAIRPAAVQEASAAVQTTVNNEHSTVTTHTAAVPAQSETSAILHKHIRLTPVNSSTEHKQNQVQTALKRSKVSKVKSKSGAGSDVELILLVILAIFIPPVAIALYEGITTRFWIDLILFLIGIGLGVGLGGIAYLCLLISIIYALLIVLGVI